MKWTNHGQRVYTTAAQARWSYYKREQAATTVQDRPTAIPVADAKTPHDL